MDSPSPPILPPVPTPPRRQERSGFLSTVIILLLALLVPLLLTAFIFQSYAVDGRSMESTLHDHDRLIVLKIQRTWSRITRHPYVPKRDDIVIFTKHDLSEFGQPGDKQLIKRVVGLPGDRVVVRDGTLTIFNAQHPNGFEPDRTEPYGSVILTTSGNVDLVVPKGEVFVCGDNRGDSLDSRRFGTVPVRDVIGKLVLRILPLSDSKAF